MRLRTFLIKLVDFYQKHAPLVKKPSCVFYPTCSEYGKTALEKYGALKGSTLLFLRIARCHPWQKNHFDPVP